MEVALVRAAELNPNLIAPVDESVIRTALSLARLYKVRHDGKDVGMGAFLAPFREDVQKRLQPVLLGTRPPTSEQLVPLASELRDRTLTTRDLLFDRFKDRIPREAIDKEVRNKALVLVSGGGGGTGYVYLGVMALLDEFGLKPSLLVGASMGSILSLFRSRMPRFDYAEMVNIVRGLSFRRMFRLVSTENRYGLPGALRLFLRAGIGRYFNVNDESSGPGLRLRDLRVPTIVTVGGIRSGMLPHPVDFYERLVSWNPKSLLDPMVTARKLQTVMGALAEFFIRPEIMRQVDLGFDKGTEDFDAVDAVGFSSSLPGVIHYDVLREDPRMHEMLGDLFQTRGLFRLIDGGLVNNMPAKTAWRAVHKGFIGTRNAFILGLNGFAPKLSTPLWLPLQRLAAMNVMPNRPYAHLVKDFKRTLSPFDVVPSVEEVTQAVELGRRQIQGDVPFLTRMLTPLPPL